MTTESQYTVDLQRFDVMVRWDVVNFPFEQSKLFEILPEHGYVLAQGVGEVPPLGGRIEVNGLAARKGQLRLNLDASRPGLALGGPDVLDTVSEFESIADILQSELRFQSQQAARFFELDAQALVWSRQSPLDTMRRRFGELAIADRFGEVLGHSVSPYGIRLVSPGTTPGSKEWHELLIEPAIRSPEHSYFGMLVFRRESWEPVKDVALRISDIFRQVVSELEGA